MLRRRPSLPSFERVKPLLLPIAAGVGALIWVVAFVTGSRNSAWDDWSPPSTMRGKNVSVWDRSVETEAEHDKRVSAKMKSLGLRDEAETIKREILGDKSKLRGDAIRPRDDDSSRDDDKFNPREACIQMKLQFPERYKDVDCMAERYDP